MASSIMHMAVTKIIANKLSLGNLERLMLGAVLPDACAEGNLKVNSHLDILFCGTTRKTYGLAASFGDYGIKDADDMKKTYDLTAFREKFAEKIKTDNLYLGYYLHLVQDLVYRNFVYHEHHWNPHISGNVKRLHNDYALLNTYVIRKYHLQNILVMPADFLKEPINALCSFDIEQFLEHVNYQFIPYDKGKIFFFTEEMADSFIKRAADICIEEVKALSAGNHGIDEYEWAWEKNTGKRSS